MGVRILVVDDQDILRDMFRGLIEQQADLKVVGEAENGHTAVRLARELSPDVVVMDIKMPVMDGIEATRRISAEAAGSRVIGVSTHSDRQTVMEMLDAGAFGYVLKSCALEQLVPAVRAVMTGARFLSPTVACILSEGIDSRNDGIDTRPQCQ